MPTTSVRVGWRTRVDVRPGLARIRESGPGVLQIIVAAGAAYAFAHFVLGHAAPLLAVTVTISSLGLVGDARPRRVLETVVGMIVGILIAELILVAAGTGWWQLVATLAASLLVARFLSPQAGFAIAAAIQSAIVMVIPANAPFLRLIDGVIGGVAALLVTALVPRRPLRTVTREGRLLLSAFGDASRTLVQALHRGDRVRAERGLQKARALQGLIDRWSVALDSGRAIARISPFLHRQRAELHRHERIRTHLDLAVRNLRVIARRSVYACDDGRPRPVAADLLNELAAGARLISDSLDDISFEPLAREALRAVAGRLDPAALTADGGTVDVTLLAALRPLAVDLLTAAGMPAAEARAALPRT
ncbi:FUSC family protein [Microbacterium sp.]|uniref:FUSC family protein n=1 Tax=Microbacterium sp. TaxID=51671 RepID=UPI0039E63E5A